jgi:RNA polymerase sigma factor (sigma-70 family)
MGRDFDGRSILSYFNVIFDISSVMSNPSLNMISDLALVALIDEGKEDAFQELYNRYWQTLYNDAFRRLGDIDKSKDVVQDVFMQFWQKASRGHVLDVAAYLKQSVRFHVIRAYHENKKLNNFELPIDMINSTQPGVDEAFFAKELEVYIEAWLSFQPERRKEIFHLRFIEDKSTKEISDLLGISQKTVQKTLFVALDSLRKSLARLVIYLLVLY